MPKATGRRPKAKASAGRIPASPLPGERWRGRVLVNLREVTAVVIVDGETPRAAIWDTGKSTWFEPKDVDERTEVMAAWGKALEDKIHGLRNLVESYVALQGEFAVVDALELADLLKQTPPVRSDSYWASRHDTMRNDPSLMMLGRL